MQFAWEKLKTLGTWLDPIQSLFALGGFLVAVVGFAYSVPKVRKELKRLRAAQEDANSNANKIGRIEEAIGDEDVQLWLRPPKMRNSDYFDAFRESIPIVTIANLKGGVGKTTIAANLAAACAARNERVLVIDLDWQGSLSSLMIGQAGFVDQTEIDTIQKFSEQLLSGEKNGSWINEAAKVVGNDLPTVKFIPSYYQLGTMENNLMFRWLLGNTTTDVRYHLSEALLTADIRDSFDRVVIDAPPRLTTACINALCTSTHLLIPTILDRQSSNAVGRFLAQVERLRPEICPNIKLLGVMGSLTYESEQPTEFESQVIIELKQRIAKVWGTGDYFLDNARVQRRAAIRDAAGQNLAYFSDDGDSDVVKAMFDELASIVIDRTG